MTGINSAQIPPWLCIENSSWDVWKVGHGFQRVGSGSTPPSGDARWYENGSIPWVTTGELRENVVKVTKKCVTDRAFKQFPALRQHPKGSLAVAMYGATIGRLGILGLAATTNQACCVLSGEIAFDTKFTFYWLWGFREHVIGWYATGGGQPNINQEAISSLRFLAPTIEKQRQIATDLDRETARIDSLIEKKTRFIELLKEKRQALITQVVTKGLDPNVPMRDSGVEWIGEVPEHWEIKKIGHLTPVKRGASPRPIDDQRYFDEDGEFGWVRIQDVTACDGILKSTQQQLSALGASKSVKMGPGRLFLSIAATVGVPCISSIKCCIHDGFVYFPNLKLAPQWLFRIFEARECFVGLGKMGTQLNLNTETVSGISIPVPPVPEIDEILSMLQKQTAYVDGLIELSKLSVDLLAERRSALITAAVTGQVDLRDV